jgi:hypothetical protein
MGSVLGIVVTAISAFLIKKARHKSTQAQTGAVTLIQRFGSALNRNAPTVSELNALVAAISQRIARHLERQGLLTRDD